MRVALLATGLFPESEVMSAVIARLEAEHEVVRIDAARPCIGEDEWDTLLDAILSSDLVLTT
jgi:hypothetical protein